MIYITKSQTNVFALTLTESATITNPYFLFKFQWEMSEDVLPVYWVGTDVSSYPDRANIFYFTEGDPNDGYDGLLKIGQYKYEVYEASTLPIDETGLDKIEEGRMVVSGTGNSIYD